MARKLKGKGNRKGHLQSALARHKDLEVQKKKIVKRNEAIVNKNESKKTDPKKSSEEKKLLLKPFIPFKPTDKLMLVGEGDFSFALSILKQGYIIPENLIITSYDNSITELNLKYPNTFNKNYDEILNFYKCKVFFKIDATQLLKSFKINNKPKFNKILGMSQIDVIMFNFPHTGKGIKDQDRNIRDHQLLVLGYFKSCQELFKMSNSLDKSKVSDINIIEKEKPEQKIILSVFEGEPYDSWNIKMLSKSLALKVERSSLFQWDLFPGYHHRRTNSEQTTTKESSERKARIYIFEKFKKEINKKKKEEDSDSE